MDLLKIFISFEADEIEMKVEQALVSESVEEVRAINQTVNHANEIWKSWVITVGGDTINLSGPSGRVWVFADHLEDLPKIIERYSKAIDSRMSVGVGIKIYESDKALAASKLHGGNRVTFYTPEIEAELEEKNDPDSDSLDFSNLGKAEHPLQGQFAQIIQEQETSEAAKQAEAERSSEVANTKSAVVQILQQVRSNSKELEQLKEEAPNLYQSIQSLVQALIMVARHLQVPSGGANIQKSEDGPPGPKAKHFVMHYPVGFLLPPGPGTHTKTAGGRLKVVKTDGKTKWVSVRSGMVMGPDGVPASSRGSEH